MAKQYGRPDSSLIGAAIFFGSILTLLIAGVRAVIRWLS